jgi:hypothetical protein
MDEVEQGGIWGAVLGGFRGFGGGIWAGGRGKDRKDCRYPRSPKARDRGQPAPGTRGWWWCGRKATAGPSAPLRTTGFAWVRAKGDSGFASGMTERKARAKAGSSGLRASTPTSTNRSLRTPVGAALGRTGVDWVTDIYPHPGGGWMGLQGWVGWGAPGWGWRWSP